MNKQPLVSILMTAYNREKYIELSIMSVLSQTYQNWELIILDDCSQDSTYAISQALSTRDVRIKAFRNKTNLGQFRNRNKIVEYARGTYLKYLDSDDLIYPFTIEQLVHYMELCPEANYGLCSIEQDFERVFPFVLSPREAYQYHYIKKKEIFYRAPLSSIIRKDAFIAAGGFPHEAVSGDFAMWNYFSLYYSVVLMPLGLVWYRVHNEQELQKLRDNVLIQYEYFKVAEYFLNHEDCPLEYVEKAKILRDLKKNKFKFIVWKTRSLGLKTGLRLISYSRLPFKLASTQ